MLTTVTLIINYFYDLASRGIDWLASHLPFKLPCKKKTDKQTKTS